MYFLTTEQSPKSSEKNPITPYVFVPGKKLNNTSLVCRQSFPLIGQASNRWFSMERVLCGGKRILLDAGQDKIKWKRNFGVIKSLWWKPDKGTEGELCFTAAVRGRKEETAVVDIAFQFVREIPVKYFDCLFLHCTNLCSCRS